MMTTAAVDLVVLHEHPEWQKPLFEALTRRGVAFAPFDLTRAAFNNDEAPRARLYFNQASPSAYLRGHTRAVPLALAYMRSLELLGARVLNGADVFALELSKSVQATLLRTLGIDTPRSITFNDPLRSTSSPATSAGPRCSNRTRAEAARGSRSSNRSRRWRRSSGAIRPSGCPTTSSCCRSTCPTTLTRASSGSSSSAASSSTRCA